MQETDFDGNEFIEDAIHQCCLQAEKDKVNISLESKNYLEDPEMEDGMVRESADEDYLVRNVLEAVGYCMNLGNYFVLALSFSAEGLADVLAFTRKEDGDDSFEVCMEYNLERVKTSDGRNLLCAFTSGEEFFREYKDREQDCPCTMVMPIEEILRFVQERDDLDGILLNRWGEGFLLDKRMYEVEEA